MPERPGPPQIDPEILDRINRGILRRTGGYRTDEHLVLPSGRHTSEYVEKALVTTEPAFTEGLGQIIAQHFGKARVDAVITTGYGAALLGHCVARAHPARPRFLYALKRRSADGRTEVALPREFGASFPPGGRVLIVEDILTTGETVRALIRLVEQMGGHVVGVGSLWKRSRAIRFKYPLFTLVAKEFPTWTPAECPMCRQGVPITREIRPGSERAERGDEEEQERGEGEEPG